MKKRISIVELYNHHEVVRVLAKLLSTKYDVTIFAEKKVLNQLGNLSAKYITKQTHETEKSFLRKQLHTLNQADIILFTTLVKFLKFYSQLSFIPTTLLLIHDGNYFIRPNKAIKVKNIKGVLRWLKFKLYREEFYRRQLLQHFSYITFADNFIAHTLSKEIKQLNINVLPALPLTYNEGLPQKSKHNKPIIIIPGSVNQNRDYRLVYEAFRKIAPTAEKTIELVLLGNASSNYGQKINALFHNLDPKRIKVTSFSSEISQEVYDEYLRKSNLAIIPIKQEFIGGIFKEEYGKTKITGSVNDVVRFGIPTLISQSYPAPSDLFVPFQDAEVLGTLILKWLSAPNNLALEFYSEDFSFPKMAERLVAIIEAT